MYCFDKLCFALIIITVMVDWALTINYLSIYLVSPQVAAAVSAAALRWQSPWCFSPSSPSLPVRNFQYCYNSLHCSGVEIFSDAKPYTLCVRTVTNFSLKTRCYCENVWRIALRIGVHLSHYTHPRRPRSQTFFFLWFNFYRPFPLPSFYTHE